MEVTKLAVLVATVVDQPRLGTQISMTHAPHSKNTQVISQTISINFKMTPPVFSVKPAS